MSSIFAPGLDVEAGQDAGPWAQTGVHPLGPVLHRRAQASQRFIVGTIPVSCTSRPAVRLADRPAPVTTTFSVHAAILPQAASVHAGVVILLFVAGVVPFSSVLFLLVALFLFASCVQYNVLARNDLQQTRPGAVANVRAWQSTERMQRAAVLSMLNTFGLGNPALQNVMAGQPAGASLHNLRLSMMNRDFTDAGKLLVSSACHVVLVGHSKVVTHDWPTPY